MIAPRPTAPMLPGVNHGARLYGLTIAGGDDNTLAASLVDELLRAAAAGLVTPAMLTSAGFDLLAAAQDAELATAGGAS